MKKPENLREGVKMNFNPFLSVQPSQCSVLTKHWVVDPDKEETQQIPFPWSICFFYSEPQISNDLMKDEWMD